MPFAEIVALTAAVMALNAFAIDMMLPALGLIGDELQTVHDNDRQKIIVYYVIANGIAQLFFGPIVDRFGRRPVLLLSIVGYIAGSILSIFASTFTLLLAARVFQGIATAATRVSITAIVRDQYAGRKMAEVMSIAITFFMVAPIIAPFIGQIVLEFGSWRMIFAILLIYGVILGVWTVLRVNETQAKADRTPINVEHVVRAYVNFSRNRQSIGYTLAGMCCFGGLFGFLSASEQILIELFEVGDFFAYAFASAAISLGAATLLNSRFVSRLGMRKIIHTAVISYIVVNLIHLTLAMLIGETLLIFLIFTSLSFFCLGFIGPNASALAMEPMGENAGAAAAANGFFGTSGAGFLGGVIGGFYTGSTTPVIVGFMLLGVSSLIVILWTERGVLFHPNPEHSK